MEDASVKVQHSIRWVLLFGSLCNVTISTSKDTDAIHFLSATAISVLEEDDEEEATHIEHAPAILDDSNSCGPRNGFVGDASSDDSEPIVFLFVFVQCLLSAQYLVDVGNSTVFCESSSSKLCILAERISFHISLSEALEWKSQFSHKSACYFGHSLFIRESSKIKNITYGDIHFYVQALCITVYNLSMEIYIPWYRKHNKSIVDNVASSHQIPFH